MLFDVMFNQKLVFDVLIKNEKNGYNLAGG